ncbi:LysR substrate-binding domain-containing protein [Chelativorans xinjiangense]|uniref:LysR substrate-binding domain-containing protein n=1 Tax=Chelativorans xinjiangense TaxID=2681485 RepID=UPI00135BF8AF|nr:LysR substrate-binding domain-containing protein [Chelativorans xinjiangense]
MAGADRIDLICFRERPGGLFFQPDSNDSQLVLMGALRSGGIALASSYSVAGELRAGRLVRVLKDFQIPSMWIKAIVPDRVRSPAVARLIEFARAALSPVAPWVREEMPPSERTVKAG